MARSPDLPCGTIRILVSIPASLPNLRPMSIGELLDQTFTLYRRRFVLFVGIMAVPALFGLATSLTLKAMQQPAPDPSLREDPGRMALAMAALFGGFLFALVIYFVAYALALGANTVALSEVYLGRDAGIRVSYKRVAHFFWPLMGLIVLLVLIVGLSFLVSFIALTLLVMLPGLVARELWFLGVIGMMFAFVAAIAVSGYLGLRYSLAVPAMVLESIGPVRALKRSAALAKGNLLRIFLVFLLLAVIHYITFAIFSLPFTIAQLFYEDAFHVESYWLEVAGSFSGSVGGMLTGPLMMIAFGLMYYDVRIRKEAFDLQFLMQRVDAAAAGNPTAPPPLS